MLRIILLLYVSNQYYMGVPLCGDYTKICTHIFVHDCFFTLKIALIQIFSKIDCDQDPRNGKIRPNF